MLKIYKPMLILLFIGTLLSADQSTELIYSIVNVVEDDVLNIRKQAKYNSDKVGDLPPEAKVIMFECKQLNSSAKWCLIETLNDEFYGYTKGWVNSKYLKPETSFTYINLHKEYLPVSVYSDPDTTSKVVMKLHEASNCYTSVKCEKNKSKPMCLVIYDIAHSDINLKSSDIYMGWIEKDKLVAQNRFGALPKEAEDGFCSSRGYIDDFFKDVKY